MCFDHGCSTLRFATFAPFFVDAHFFSSPGGNETTRMSASTNPSPLGLALVKVAGGDREILRALRSVAWSEYQAAGSPFGGNEEGMELWWAEQLAVQID